MMRRVEALQVAVVISVVGVVLVPLCIPGIIQLWWRSRKWE